jgi:hypothetical protein
MTLKNSVWGFELELSGPEVEQTQEEIHPYNNSAYDIRSDNVPWVSNDKVPLNIPMFYIIVFVRYVPVCQEFLMMK